MRVSKFKFIGQISKMKEMNNRNIISTTVCFVAVFVIMLVSPVIPMAVKNTMKAHA